MEREMDPESRRILVVEDDEGHAELVCRAFDDRNGRRYVVALARSLREARHCLDDSVPDLVIADLLLPDGKGTELVEDHRIGGRIPLIVMTSHGSEQAAVDALKGGALDYVVKSELAFLDMPRTAERALREWGHMTERKRAEDALKERELLLRAMFDNHHVAMLIIDPEAGTIEDASPGACTFYGYSREELQGKTIGEISLSSPEETFERLQVAKSQQRKYFDFRHRLASGEVRDVEVCSGPIVVGGSTLLFSVVTDVTDRKNAEAALRESEERFRAVFESAEDCIFVKNHSLRYTHVNSAMCRLLGLPASKIVGRGAEHLYGHEVGKQVTEWEARVLAGESIETEQTRRVRGMSLTFHDTLAPLRNQAGDIIGVCGISRDITERKKLAGASPVTPEQHRSPTMRATLAKARVAADTDSIVLLLGESGSGKDHLARWIHEHSRRKTGPFFSINCAALPKDLAESELFGHERGAFTGAVGLKKGLLELAEGGTILLNEIGELDLSLQAKLLTFLDTRSFLRVGGQKHIRVNARLIAATHRDLSGEVSAKRFLEPLFYRLSVFPIPVPALRERLEDMPILVEEIMAKIATELQLTTLPVIDQRHITCLGLYSWPGNIRELRNVLERSLMLWKGGEFNPELPHGQRSDREWSYMLRYAPGRSLRDITDEVADSLCAEVLRLCNDNKKETARVLDISRDTLYRHIRKLKRYSKT